LARGYLPPKQLLFRSCGGEKERISYMVFVIDANKQIGYSYTIERRTPYLMDKSGSFHGANL